MASPAMIQTRTQHFMLASGMLYSIVQVGILVFAGVYLLPLLGPPGGTHEQRYEGYANYPYLFKVGNYLMGLPALFFFLFLGGVYSHFSRIDISVRGILLTALLSGAVLAMIWPFGAVISLIGVDIAAAGGDRITGGAFDSVVPYSLGLSTIPRAAFLFSLSILFIENKWLCLTGLLIGCLSLAGNLILISGKFLPLSLGSALLFHVWVFCASLKMFRATRSAISFSPVGISN